MEFGPRALGGRSILGDPRSPKMQSVMNLKIKFRESFRPVRAERAARARRASTSSSTADSPVHAAGRAGAAQQRRIPMTRRAAAPLRHREAERAALRHPGRHPRRLLGAHPDRARARRTRSTTRCSRAFTRSPAARCWSTPASTCAASRSSARPRTPTAASCAPRWTRSSSARSSSRRRASRRSRDDVDWRNEYELD